jgi:phospho-N-acetylmuramoyl-pentapeptide-transferase
MLIAFFDYLSRYAGELQVFQYLTVRTILSILTAFTTVMLGMPWVIRWCNRMRISETVREDGPESHLSKTDTPTMGGAFFVPAIVFSTLLWTHLANFYIWMVLLATMLFAAIGFVDDALQLRGAKAKGMSVKGKLFWQVSCGLLLALLVYIYAPASEMTQLMVPIFKNIQYDLGMWFIPMSVLVIVGSSNAVNLTDGLDGLAIMPVVLVCGALGLIAYLAGHSEFAHYLYIPYIAGSGELAVFCGAIAGAGLGFLWFNAHPAQIFMGDTGALSLGAAMGMVAVLTRHELVLFIMGGIFIIEALSVMVQVGSYKLRRKRVFGMAPIHHHFELKGVAESKVIVRFWIVTVLLVLFGLATLKFR